MNTIIQAISKHLKKHNTEHKIVTDRQPARICTRYNNYIGIRPQNPNQHPFHHCGRQYHLVITHETTTNTIKLENNYYRFTDDPGNFDNWFYYNIIDYNTADPNLLQRLLQDIQKAQDQYA